MSFSRDKIITSLLLFAFVFTTLGSIPGFAWCFGEDGHFEIEYVASGDCDEGGKAWNHLVEESAAHLEEDHCGPCIDLYLQAHDATSAKRVKLRAPIVPDVVPCLGLPKITSQSVKMVVGNLVPQPPRISLTILEHRTTVLLN